MFINRNWKSKPMKFLVLMLVAVSTVIACSAKNNISFRDDFENGTGKWDLISPDKIRIVDSGDPSHGKVLALHPGGATVSALIKDSNQWANIRIEGDVYFPYLYNASMAVIYNHNLKGTQPSFGSVYIYGPNGADLKSFRKNHFRYIQIPPGKFLGNVVQVNPHRGNNSSRALYPEFWTPLTGAAAIKTGEWGHFKAEIVGSTCHFYVKDMETPVITNSLFELSSGRVGFQPRFEGAVVYIDNIKVTGIAGLTYTGPPLPSNRNYKPSELITQWDVIGPFWKRMNTIDSDGYLPGKTYRLDEKDFKWRPFKTDARGCVLIGQVCDRYTGDVFAYFHTEVSSDTEKEITVEFSSSNNMDLFANGKRVGNIPIHRSSWYDFLENPKHPGSRLKVKLKPGKNHLVVFARASRVDGGGFYAGIKEAKSPASSSSEKNGKSPKGE
ncbi:MAG: hypothetical protein GY940_07610 [bacterium]|nr:hypothetical protein [bacterium]